MTRIRRARRRGQCTRAAQARPGHRVPAVTHRLARRARRKRVRAIPDVTIGGSCGRVTVTGTLSRATGGGSTAGRARSTTLSYCQECRIVGVQGCTVVVRRVSTRAGVRLGVSTAAALWRTGSDSRLAGGGSSTGEWARSSGLRSCSFVGSVGADEGGAASPVLTGTRFLDGDGAIGGVYGRGDDVDF